MKVRSFGYSIPVEATCAECGEPFKAGDSVTLNPARHRMCDATAVLIDDYMTRALTDLARNLDAPS